jgi:hypothetical protein
MLIKRLMKRDNQMDFTTYGKQAIKTASCDSKLISARIQIEPTLALVHAAMGMASEVGEVLEWLQAPKKLSNAELVSELGDCLWFMNLLIQEFETDFDQLYTLAGSQADALFTPEAFYENIEMAVEIMAVAAGKVNDSAKAALFYGRLVNLDVVFEACEIYLSGIILCCRALKITLEGVMESNIAKLRTRYGEVFSEEKANQRDLLKEQNAYTKRHGIL